MNWKCPCEGEDFKGLPTPKNTELQYKNWSRIFGEGLGPNTCPWYAFYDPFIEELYSIYGDIGGFTERGPDYTQLTALLGDPPHILIEGIRYLRRAMSNMKRQVEYEQEQKANRLNNSKLKTGR